MNAPVPQQARAVRTREALLDAAAACLGEHGLAGTTTARVARTAGLSQGALFRHFPTKAELLAGAAERVLAGLVVRFVGAVQDDPQRDGEDLLSVGLRALWVVYTDPALYGVFELFLAARTDAELQAALQPVLDAHFQVELSLARELFPHAAGRADFDDVVAGLLTTLQGAAVSVATRPTADASLELRFIERLARTELGLPLPGPSSSPAEP